MKTLLKTCLLYIALLGLGPSLAHAFYDPGAQRWLNRDPLGKSRSQNLNTFNRNSPNGFIDAWGHIHVVPGRTYRHPTDTSIVCDGKGGIRVYWPPTLDPKGRPMTCEQKCTEEHERSHMADALNENPDICKGQSDGTTLSYDDEFEQAEGEIRASQIELECLDRCKHPGCEDAKKGPNYWLEHYRDWLKSQGVPPIQHSS